MDNLPEPNTLTDGRALLYVMADATVKSNMPPLFSSGCHAAVEREMERKEMNKTFHFNGTIGYPFYLVFMKGSNTIYQSKLI